MKIWNGSTDGRDWCIVVAKSQKRALELLNKSISPNMSLHHFREYWHNAGGKYENQLLSDGKECVWCWDDIYKDEEKCEKYYDF